MAKDSKLPPFFGKDFNANKSFEFPGINLETLLTSYQKNMEMMNETQKIAKETAQSLMEIQKEYVQKLMAQATKKTKKMAEKAPLEAKNVFEAETTKATVNEIVEHLRSTNSIITKSNEKIIESIQRRFKEVLNESSDLIKKRKKNGE